MSKKPAVTKETQREWLRRFEKEGESPPSIAKKDEYDVRTVRKCIEIAMQERDIREAKLTVLKEAMVDHYKDLCEFAEDLRSEIGDEKTISDDMLALPFGSALKQHIPRSSLWRNIEKWNHEIPEIALLEAEIPKLVGQNIPEIKIKNLESEKVEEVRSGIAEFINDNILHQARGNAGLNTDEIFRPKYLDHDISRVELGTFLTTEISTEDVPLLHEFVSKSESDVIRMVKEREEYLKLERAHQSLFRLKGSLEKEILTITLRRVVPGRCQFCPM